MRVDADPLKHFQWKTRVLVLSAPTGGDPDVRSQDEVLGTDPQGQADRELVVLRLVGDMVANGLSAAAVRERLSMPPDRFEVVLLGLDGMVALRRSKPVSLPELFARIDAMPMRREALRKAQEPSQG